jgi:hypothetical protein
MRSRGEQFDRFKSVGGDVDQVLAAQSLLVKQVSGNAEAVHNAINAQGRMRNARAQH